MYTKEKVKKVQKRLLEMAIVIRDILEKHNIPYFITYGTLLGAVRHKGFIPWDDDFDFYLFDDSYNRALSTLKSEMPSNLFLEYFESEPSYFHGWAHVKDINSYAECELFPQDGTYQHHGISVDLYRAFLVPEKMSNLFLIQQHIDYLERRYDKGAISKEDKDKRFVGLFEKLKIEESAADIKDGGRLMYVFPGLYQDFMYPEEIWPLKEYQFENELFLGPNNADVFLTRCYKNYMNMPPVEKRHPHYSDVIFNAE